VNCEAPAQMIRDRVKKITVNISVIIRLSPLRLLGSDLRHGRCALSDSVTPTILSESDTRKTCGVTAKDGPPAAYKWAASKKSRTKYVNCVKKVAFLTVRSERRRHSASIEF